MGDSEETISTRGTAISMGPRTLVVLLLSAAGLAGGGGSWLTGLLHGGQATSVAQESGAVQLAVLQTKVTNIESQQAEFKQELEKQTELIRRLLLHESEDHGKRQ